MNCLCCGMPIPTDVPEERETMWHTACVKKFFGTQRLPDVDITEEVLEQLARESTNKGYTVPGVQRKLSLHLTGGEGSKAYLGELSYGVYP